MAEKERDFFFLRNRHDHDRLIGKRKGSKCYSYCNINISSRNKRKVAVFMESACAVNVRLTYSLFPERPRKRLTILCSNSGVPSYAGDMHERKLRMSSQ